MTHRIIGPEHIQAVGDVPLLRRSPTPLDKAWNRDVGKMMEEYGSTMQFPCIRNCCLNDDDTCLGCCRSLEEITGWNEADDDQRKVIMQNARQRREAYSLGKGN